MPSLNTVYEPLQNRALVLVEATDELHSFTKSSNCMQWVSNVLPSVAVVPPGLLTTVLN